MITETYHKNRKEWLSMKTKYTVVNTYSASSDAQKEKAKSEASRGVYRELLRYAESKSDRKTA